MIGSKGAGRVVSRIKRMLPTTFAYCALVIVGGLFEAASRPLGLSAILGMTGIGVVAMSLVVWGQWFINDVYDKETDKHSNPNRETTRGAISDHESLLIGSTLTVIGAAFTLVLGLYAFTSLAGYIVVNTAYSVPPFRLKSGGVSSMFALGTMGGFSTLLGSAAIVSEPTQVSLLLAVTVLGFMALSMSYKDLKDADHDEKSGVENITVKYGPERVRKGLMVILPASYLIEALLFELYVPLPLFLLMGAYVVYLLHSWGGENDIVYKLDAVNGMYLLSLGVAYYFLK